MGPEGSAVVIAIITLFVTLFGIIAGTTVGYLQLRQTAPQDIEAQLAERAVPLFSAA